MYDNVVFQVTNPINRFAIGNRDKLKFIEDGSLDIYIQVEAPDPEKGPNWLPAPKCRAVGPTMRLYGPTPQVSRRRRSSILGDVLCSASAHLPSGIGNPDGAIPTTCGRDRGHTLPGAAHGQSMSPNSSPATFV